MKRFFAISLLLIYLISATELCQFLKVPMLLAHYTEHCRQTNNDSFLKYLTDHYVDDDGTDSDNDTDQKLPFKKLSGGQVSALFIPFHGEISMKGGLYSEKVVYPFRESFLLPSHLSAIWQPPKSI